VTIWNIFVGCFTKELWDFYPRAERDMSLPSQGIERLLFDDLNGSIKYAGSWGLGLSSPQYIQLHPSSSIIYAAEFAHPGRLTALTIKSDGSLEQLSTIPTRGSMAVAVDLHPKGIRAYVAHLGDGTLTTCNLNERGEIENANAFSGSFKSRRRGRPSSDPLGYGGGSSKLHHLRVLPRGDGLVVADVGLDQVVTYRLGEEGELDEQPISRIQFPVGSAPRHIEFGPTGDYVFVVGECDATLYVLEAEDFVPVRIAGSYSVVPSSFRGRALPSELQLHPDGSTLFIGVRRADCITAFTIDELGVAEVMYHEPCQGSNPRAVRIDPVGRHLLVGHWQSNSISVFSIDAERRLNAIENSITVPSPSSIAFVKTSIMQQPLAEL
jgi:6-phosphogluconolactonase